MLPAEDFGIAQVYDAGRKKIVIFGGVTPMFEKIAAMGHEQVVLCHDPSVGYRGIIAIHSTVLGPAVGGTRFWPYATEEEAFVDALRLARGMTYKNAVAGLKCGGGKAVIIGDNRRTDREALFRAHGRFIERLGGCFITGEDVGTTATDMEYVHMETNFVGGISERGGDPSPWTAQGVFRGIQASAMYKWGADDLSGKRVAIQGCGSVGYHLAKALREAGATLIVADLDPDRARRVAVDFNAVAVEPESIISVEADIFAPCALGGIINDHTIPQLRAEIVAGAANNQLLEARHGEALMTRGILYAPDYVINAGGVINGIIAMNGGDPAQRRSAVYGIYDTLLTLFEMAALEGIPTFLAADHLAEQRLRSG